MSFLIGWNYFISLRNPQVTGPFIVYHAIYLLAIVTIVGGCQFSFTTSFFSSHEENNA